MHRITQHAISGASWLAAVAAALASLEYFLTIETAHAIHDFGVVAAGLTLTMLWLLPLLMLASCSLMYWSHPHEERWPQWMYRGLVCAALIGLFRAAADFAFNPTYGWDLLLGR